MKWYALLIFTLFSILGICLLRVEIADVELETSETEVELAYQRSLSAYQKELRAELEFQELVSRLFHEGKTDDRGH